METVAKPKAKAGKRAKYAVTVSREVYRMISVIAHHSKQKPGAVIAGMLLNGNGKGFAILLAALLWASGLNAQNSESASGQALLTVLQSTNLVKTSDLNFGTHFASEGVITCQSCTPMRFDGLGTAGRIVDFSVVVPSVLTRVGNTATVPIAFGTQSLLVELDGGPTFHTNPTGVFGVALTGTGGFRLSFGTAPGSAAEDILVTVSGAAGGNYAGTVVLTVTQH